MKKYYVISYSFGDNTEYWNSSLIADEFSSKLIENAEGFETEQEAKKVLEETVKPYAEAKEWNVSFSIDEVEGETYDIVFNDEENSNNKGFAISLEDAKHYIEKNNGTNESYFADYKGGTVSIVCNETGKTVFETEVEETPAN
jgi:hypothetical protein